MLFYVFVFFRITPQKNINSKKITKANALTCKDIMNNNQYFFPLDGTDFRYTCSSFDYCDSSNMIIYNSKFSNFRIVNDTTTAYLFKTNNVNLNITLNTFINIRSIHTMIHCNGNNQLFTLESNIINDCHSYYDVNGTIVEVFVQNTDIQNNDVYFKPDGQKGRAFSIKYHTGCKFIGNHISNALYSRGCCLNFELCSTNYPPLQISDCTFTSCLGDNSAIFCLAELDTKLTLTNVTFEKSKNNAPHFGGYYINIGGVANHDPIVVFDRCKFSYLESNANAGGAIGLWLILKNFQ